MVKEELVSPPAESGRDSSKLVDKYEVLFPSTPIIRRFEKDLSRVSREDQKIIANALREMAGNPFPRGKKSKKLTVPLEIGRCLAQYRWRVGNYRIFYDVVEERKHVLVFGFRRRNERTYSD